MDKILRLRAAPAGSRIDTLTFPTPTGLFPGS
jgi:hypothetical protein